MQRVIAVSGIAILLSAAWVIRARHSSKPSLGALVQPATTVNVTAIRPSDPSEREFRQKIRSIVQKVSADIKKEQASTQTTSNRVPL